MANRNTCLCVSRWGATGPGAPGSASACLRPMGTGKQAAGGTPASGCPEGTFDNSPVPARRGWVPDPGPGSSPIGTAEAIAIRNVRRLHFSRPYGTKGLVTALFPSDKSLGYSHKVPTGQRGSAAVQSQLGDMYSCPCRCAGAAYGQVPARRDAHATRPLATGYRLLATLPAARRRSQDFVSFPSTSRLSKREKEKQSCTDL